MDEQLKNTMAIVFRLHVDEINEFTSMDDVESWDSLTHLNLVSAIEEEFNVTFSDSETVDLLNYGIIKAFLLEKLNST